MSLSSSSSSTCSRCGVRLRTEDTQGLCPVCLLAEAMAPTQTGAAHSVPLPPLSPEELAPCFPQLEILECLGRGGMGVVYKARQKSLDRLVALKLLAPERADDPGFAQRFASEARALAAFNHPHIVSIHDFGQAGGYFYLLMEYVDGLNLRQLIASKKLTPREALAIIPPICEALQCAHDRGIVHRDIKPENLLLDRQGVVKIADFGIAKMIRAQEDTVRKPCASRAKALAGGSLVLGTPDYAAPEQCDPRGSPDHRADIYSLGVVLYEMLTGERPTARLEPPSRRVQVDVRIDEVVLRALEKAPERRYATAAEFGTQVQTVAAAPPLEKRRPPRRWKWLRTGLSVAVAVLLVRTFLVCPYLITGRSLEPELPVGSRVLVWVPARHFVPGDLVAYLHQKAVYVGRVTHSSPSQVSIGRNDTADETVTSDAILGSVASVYWRATPTLPPPRSVKAAMVHRGTSEVSLEALGTVETPTLAIFDIPENQVPEVVRRFDEHQSLRVEAFNSTHTEKRGTGVLSGVDNRIDVTTGTLKCRATLAAEPHALLYPGMFLNIRLILDTHPQALLIPLAILQQDPVKGTYTWLIEADGRVTRREIQVANAQGGEIEVLSGLNEGDRLIEGDAQNLKEGDFVSVVEKVPNPGG